MQTPGHLTYPLGRGLFQPILVKRPEEAPPCGAWPLRLGKFLSHQKLKASLSLPSCAFRLSPNPQPRLHGELPLLWMQAWFDDRVEARNALVRVGRLWQVKSLDRSELPWIEWGEREPRVLAQLDEVSI
jgi:hypothetical protein